MFSWHGNFSILVIMYKDTVLSVLHVGIRNGKYTVENEKCKNCQFNTENYGVK